MRLSRTGKAVAGAIVVVGLATYLVIVDFGVFAGRVHAGVMVAGVDVSGKTYQEAADELRIMAMRLRNEDVTFTTDGFSRTLDPSHIDWRARPIATARRAFSVGRDGRWYHALADRWTALTGGVEVEWAYRLDRRALRRTVRRWAREAAAHGLEVDRKALRRQIRRAIPTWPRREFTVPLRDG